MMKKNGIRVVFKKGRTLGSLLVRTKASTQIEKSKDHIYLKNCSTCKSMYIGETGQYQKKRDQGHKADINKERSPIVSSCTLITTKITRSIGKLQKSLTTKKTITEGLSKNHYT